MSNEPQFVTCPCQVCAGNIEFDPSGFENNETCTVECPHCKMETILFVPQSQSSKTPVFRPTLTPDQVVSFLKTIFQTQKPPDQHNFYTLIMSPGVVRYMDPKLFWNTDIEKLIGAVKLASENPGIKTPEYCLGEITAEDTAFINFHGRVSFKTPTMQSSMIDQFIEDESWETKLRVHHVFGYFFIKHRLPTHVYAFFHRGLKLGKQFTFGECVASWVADAIENKDLAESFNGSPEHLVNVITEGEHYACYVFKKTAFVEERLAMMAKEVEEQNAAEEAERLRRSGFPTFIYIMQDMRNGAYKIGRSITPGKRERTLQSEVPEIVLRFSIPADEIHEKNLHDYFEAKNLRGEWFALEPNDLIWVISYLKQHGDLERVSANHEWLGQVFLLAKN